MEQKVLEAGFDHEGCSKYMHPAIRELRLRHEASQLDRSGVTDLDQLKQVQAFHTKRAKGSADPPTDAA
jgi:hypothetical protein